MQTQKPMRQKKDIFFSISLWVFDSSIFMFMSLLFKQYTIYDSELRRNNQTTFFLLLLFNISEIKGFGCLEMNKKFTER